jgi:hypothetical protein
MKENKIKALTDSIFGCLIVMVLHIEKLYELVKTKIAGFVD